VRPPSRSPQTPPTQAAEQAEDAGLSPLSATSPAISRILTPPPRPGPFAPGDTTGSRLSMTADSPNRFHFSRADSLMGADSGSDLGGTSATEAGAEREFMMRAVDVGSDHGSWESV